jgi:hypothetical protein
MNDAEGGFDVRAFARSAQGRFRDELDLDMFATQPLATDDRTLIRFFARVEGASMDHFRNVLMTATHKDARVTAFLITWAYEKQWIADALGAVLEAHGEPPIADVAEGAARRRFSEWAAWRGPLWRALASLRQGDDVVAAHVTIGLIDEWVMAAGYEMVAETADSSPLTKVLDRVAAVRQRHEEFLAAESRRRLIASPRAIRLTRSVLRRQVWPIGSLRRAAGDRDRFTSIVFAGVEGRDRAMAIGDRVAGLTGLSPAGGATVARILRS